jgi:hypothetical protein
VVVKIEEIDPNWTYSPLYHGKTYDDQDSLADDPAWGMRIKRYAIYASDLKADVRIHRVIGDILSPWWSGGKASIQTVSYEPDQLAYTSIPYTRREALDDINSMFDYDYGVWAGDVFHWGAASAAVTVISATNPQVRLSLRSGVSDSFNACRIAYTNRRGKRREVIQHIASGIPTVKAKTIEAPESIRTKSAALRLADKFLRNHHDAIVTGSATLMGAHGEWGDAMLMQPDHYLRIRGVPRMFAGPHKITSVQLDPVAWEATLEFGLQSTRFERWLRRLESKNPRIR